MYLNQPFSSLSTPFKPYVKISQSIPSEFVKSSGVETWSCPPARGTRDSAALPATSARGSKCDTTRGAIGMFLNNHFVDSSDVTPTVTVAGNVVLALLENVGVI